ncbi:endolytic transglycosylase MltG, partial [Corynebacterium sp.]|uniref:endolytic transglycosylase MltG n=1 Tax=Corynebacterium sp. TaxID=1720 RepID=UPI002A91A173
QPGFYRLQKEMSAESAVAALLDPANKITPLQVYGGATLLDVAVVGGQTRLGILSMIQQVTCGGSPKPGCVTVEELYNVAANEDPAQLGVPAWAMDAVNQHSGDPKRLEGLIAPGEYIVNPDASAEEILTDLITRSANQYESTDIVNRAAAIGLTPYELLTAASLVEREAPAGEFGKVARVILNRLAEPMRLEFDSTVNYGLPSVEVATTDEDRLRPTPWNTYAKDGLPETPIASPSMEAIEAMENPEEGDWLFFVTIDSDGTTVFNNTFEEHLDDVTRAVESGILDSNR